MRPRKWTLSLFLAAAGQAAGLSIAVAGSAENAGAPVLPQIAASIELVSDNLGVSVMHGWHANRLIEYGGKLYASGFRPPPDKENFWPCDGVFFRREADGHWAEQAGKLPLNPYTMMVGPDGRFWTIASSDYPNCHMYRMQRPLDFSTFEEVRQGTAAYYGAGVSPEGNFLILYAERNKDLEDFRFGIPNAVIGAFYDQQTGKWHMSRMVTPEGRYGYEGIILRGRRALVVLNSAIADPKANPTPPHYSWRHVRLACCDDLTKGEWRNVGWLMPPYGATGLQDLILGPDGDAYLSYAHSGADTLEEASKEPSLHYIAHIKWDLTAEAFATGINVSSNQILLDSRKGWHLVGRAVPVGGDLHLWDLDPANGFKPTKEYVLSGTSKPDAYIIHTLRPERFGGESDGDIVHLLTASYVLDSSGKPDHAMLWHAFFKLPVAE